MHNGMGFHYGPCKPGKGLSAGGIVLLIIFILIISDRHKLEKTVNHIVHDILIGSLWAVAILAAITIITIGTRAFTRMENRNRNRETVKLINMHAIPAETKTQSLPEIVTSKAIAGKKAEWPNGNAHTWDEYVMSRKAAGKEI